MAHRIVDLLEAIQVDKEESTDVVVEEDPGLFPFKFVVETVTIEQSGQTVVVRQPV